MTDPTQNKLQQNSILGLLGALVALQGWGAVHPQQIEQTVKAQGEAIAALREHQSELRFSIQMLAENVRRLTEVIEKAHPGGCTWPAIIGTTASPGGSCGKASR